VGSERKSGSTSIGIGIKRMVSGMGGPEDTGKSGMFEPAMSRKTTMITPSGIKALDRGGGPTIRAVNALNSIRILMDKVETATMLITMDGNDSSIKMAFNYLNTSSTHS